MIINHEDDDFMFHDLFFVTPRASIDRYHTFFDPEEVPTDAKCVGCGEEAECREGRDETLGEWCCESCACDWADILAEEEYEDAIEDAKRFAIENCKLTDDVEVYDPFYRNAPTREEYENGMKEAYTENAVAAHNRHNCSNYDQLIENLDKESPRDQAFYDFIRARIEKLIEDRCANIEETEQI